MIDAALNGAKQIAKKRKCKVDVHVDYEFPPVTSDTKARAAAVVHISKLQLACAYVGPLLVLLLSVLLPPMVRQTDVSLHHADTAGAMRSGRAAHGRLQLCGKVVEPLKGLLYLRFLMVPLSHLPVQLLEAIRAAAALKGAEAHGHQTQMRSFFLPYVPRHLWHTCMRSCWKPSGQLLGQSA